MTESRRVQCSTLNQNTGGWIENEKMYGEEVKNIYQVCCCLVLLPVLLSGHPARWMIWEGEPTAETVAGLKKLGVGSVVFELCGNTPASGDFLSRMRSNLANLQVINQGK